MKSLSKKTLTIAIAALLVCCSFIFMPGSKAIKPTEPNTVVKLVAAVEEPVVEVKAPTVVKQREEMKVMSFNILRGDWFWGWEGNGRKDKIVDIMFINDPDVICLQEALKFQVDDIQDALHEYGSYGVGRSDGDTKGEYCPIFYRLSRFDFLDSGTFWLSKTPNKAGSTSWGSLAPRICSWVKLQDKTIDTPVFVYNAHTALFSENARNKSLDLILDKMECPYILAGDFNKNMNDSYFARDGGVQYTALTDKKQKDFIISSDDFILDHYGLDDTFEKYPSDHRALTATIK